MRIFTTALLVFVYLVPLLSQESPNQKTYRTPATRIEQSIELTGRLSDPMWSLAPEIPVTFEVQPGENIPAPQKTIAKILYNSEYLYVGFVCYESNMKQLRAHISDRDKIFEDDFVVFIIDTYGDKQRAYEFFVNPLGIQADILRAGNNEDDSWDAIWHSAAMVMDSAWTVEMAIPFKSIRFPVQQTQDWIILVGRNAPRSSRAIFSWTPFNRNDPCFLCQGGVLEGIRDIEATSAVELLPYIVGQQRGVLNDTDNPSSSFINGALRGETIPSTLYVALVTSATAPTADTNTKSQLTEIANGNGYTTGGIAVGRNSTDFDVWTEDDDNDLALVQIKDLTWTASGGNIPASGSGARYAILTDDNATQGNREVYFYWSLGADRTVSDTQFLRLVDLEIQMRYK